MGPFADVINFAEFCGNRLMSGDSVGVRICHLQLTWPVAVNTVLPLPRSL